MKLEEPESGMSGYRFLLIVFNRKESSLRNNDGSVIYFLLA
ncbi:MAG: hypothetical protein ACTHN6_05055 [Parafilimonas sp.]